MGSISFKAVNMVFADGTLLNANKVADRGSSIDIIIDVDRFYVFDSGAERNLQSRSGPTA